MKAHTTLAVLLLCLNFIQGQAIFSDANLAMVLCDNEPVVIQELSGAGLNAAENINLPCTQYAFPETN